MDRAEFTTHHARRILTGLGFVAGRRVHAPGPERDDRSRPPRGRPARARSSAETLEPFVGQGVATRGDEVLVAAPEPRSVVGGHAITTQLELRQGARSHTWRATVYFCDPWPWAFGLLGLGGLDPFVLELDAYEEWLTLRPR